MSGFSMLSKNQQDLIRAANSILGSMTSPAKKKSSKLNGQRFGGRKKGSKNRPKGEANAKPKEV